MSGFNAGSIVEPLDYDFTAYDGRKGVIPEPTEEATIALYSEMDELVKKLAGDFVELPENASAQDLLGALNQLTMSESYKPMLDGMTRIYAKFCAGSPSEDEIRLLPPRIRGLFFQWIARELRPEISAVDSKKALRPLRIAQGG